MQVSLYSVYGHQERMGSLELRYVVGQAAYKLPKVGTGNQTLGLCKNRMFLTTKQSL